MIQDPQMSLVDDGTQTFTFTIPMYIHRNNEFKENPIWYNTRNGNLMVNLRKIKVIFNKQTDVEETFEFLITKVTEEHESDHLFCNVECEGLAFHELGKIGYLYDLSLADFELSYKEWSEDGKWKMRDGTEVTDKPIQNVQYWCDKIGLLPAPANEAEMDPRRWYYEISMDWSSFQQSEAIRARDKVYEEEFVTGWQLDNSYQLIPTFVEKAREKERTVEIKESNIYNITQKIAETFNIYCKYVYGHDNNYHIIYKKIVFFNNYLHDNYILSLTYPYSSKKITREMDGTDTITKMYVKSVENSSTLLGEDSIRYCPANKMQEDYIFNFDYLKETGGITQEQYDAIEKYEADLYRINTELYTYENKLALYSNQEVDLSAKKTFYEGSIDLDKEQINQNSDLALALIAENGNGAPEGYIGSCNEDNPEYTLITEDEYGNYCIKLNNKKKGIHTSSLKIYRKYSSLAEPGKKLTKRVKGFRFTYDEYGNASRIYGVEPAEGSSAVYLTYWYEPKLYYDAIVASWTEKLANDTKALEEINLQLDHDPSQDPAGEQKPAGLKQLIESAQSNYEQLLAEKKAIIEEFNYMMGPALREGNWTPEDYQDYGERHELEQTFVTSWNEEADDNFHEGDTGTGFFLGWDNKLFDQEQNIFFLDGVNQTERYYPCINLSALYSSDSEEGTYFREHLSEYSFIFNNNYYDTEAELDLISNIRSFSIGSEAILGFVKNSEGNIYPALILTGAKTMSTDDFPATEGDTTILAGGTQGFMLDPNRGHPRIGIITTTVTNNNVTTTIEHDTNIDSSYYSFGGDTIEQCKVVLPRIKFSSLMLKFNDNQFYIHCNDQLLKNYEDYYIRNRHIESGTYAPEFVITLKPEVIIKQGKLDNIIKAQYNLSNAGTAIYLDAKEIAKENAYPKVAYTVDPNLINKGIVSTLYSKMNWLVMINDVQLKFENTFGYISKIDLNLDFPDEDAIEVKNYKTKFEDLFSSIVASSETVQANTHLLSSLAGGAYTIQEESFIKTLENNSTILDSYLSDFFKNNEDVQGYLSDLFSAAGTILSDTNNTLNQSQSLSTENAAVLNNFAQTIASELTPTVFRQSEAPLMFKKGDVWLQVNNGSEIARYIATSDSSNSGGGKFGWIKTYNGSLAEISGAAMNVDAAAGRVDLFAGNEINIAAGETVNITGDKFVNIGGVQINIGSESNQTQQWGGINLVATSYNTEDFTDAHVSKVLINPEEIYMAGSKITMLSGTTDGSTNAISLDGTVSNNIPYGIWLGSNKGIGLSSTSTEGSANVEINPTHIFFGVGGTSSSTALELTKDYMILAGGGSIQNIEDDGIDVDNTLVGMEIRKDKIALATSVNNKKTIMIMDGSGFLVGSQTISSSTINDPISEGSYVQISGEGVTIGSQGKLNINTSNFVINSDGGTNVSVFKLANNQNTALEYKNGQLTITGSIVANSFILQPGAEVSGLSTEFTTRTRLTQSGGTEKQTAELNTAGALVLSSNEGFYILRNTNTNTTLDNSYVTINSSGMAFDYDSDNYVHIDRAGIEVKGRSITINGEDVWSRSDIIYADASSPSKFTHPSHDWVWIKPRAETTITATYGTDFRLYDYTSTYPSNQSSVKHMTRDGAALNQTAASTTVTITFYYTNNVQNKGNGSVSIQFCNSSGTNSGAALSYTFSNISAWISSAKKVTVSKTITTSAFGNNNGNIYFKISTTLSTGSITITKMVVTATGTESSSSRALCDVYYYY